MRHTTPDDRPRRSGFPLWLMIALGLAFTMMVSGCATGVVLTLLAMSRRAEHQAEAKAAEAMMTPVESVQLAPPTDERAERLNRFRLDDHEWPKTHLDDFTEIRPLLLSRSPADAVQAVVGGAAGWKGE